MESRLHWTWNSSISHHGASKIIMTQIIASWPWNILKTCHNYPNILNFELSIPTLLGIWISISQYLHSNHHLNQRLNHHSFIESFTQHFTIIKIWHLSGIFTSHVPHGFPDVPFLKTRHEKPTAFLIRMNFTTASGSLGLRSGCCVASDAQSAERDVHVNIAI